MTYKKYLIYYILIISRMSSVVGYSQLTVANSFNVRCGGTIENVGGGLPASNSSEMYTLKVTDALGIDVTRGCNASDNKLGFGDDWTFQVPAPGTYMVSISDQTGRDTTLTFVIADCDPIEFFYGTDANGDPGDTICQDITVNNYGALFSFTLRVTYDETVLDFVQGSIVLNPDLSTGFFSVASPIPGQINAVYFDAVNLVPLPDGSTIFSACFVLKNVPGSSSVFDFDATSPSYYDFFSGERCNLPWMVNSSIVSVNTVNPPTNVTEGFGGCSTNSNLGSIILGPYSGVAQYLYVIRDTSNLSVILRSGTINDNSSRGRELGLSPGTYQVTVTDANNVMQVALVTIPRSLEMDVDLTPMNPTCSDRSDGSVSISQIQGGIAPYTNVWFDETGAVINMDVSSISGLPNGEITIEVTDANGCVVTAKTDVETNELVVNVESTMPTCPGSLDGVLQARASGGSSPFNNDFTWEYGSTKEFFPGAFLAEISGISTGQYIITATDANGCFVRDTINLTPLFPFEADSIFTDVTCFGDSDAMISVIPPSSTSTISYLWEDGSTDSIRTNLTAGLYTVLVTDALCSDSLIFNISSPDTLNIAINEDFSTPFLCDGDTTSGQIHLKVFSGITSIDGLTIDWTNNVAQDALDAINLPGGDYVAVITTASGCVDSAFYTITEVPPIQFSVPPIDIPNCPGESTSITVDTASGGVGGGYTFSIDGGAEVTIGTMVPIFAGNHSIEVFDSIGCSTLKFESVDDATPLIINLPEILVIELGDTTQILNPDIRPISERGTIVSYDWSPALELDCATCENTLVKATNSREYTLTIIDNRGCTFSKSVFVEVKKNRNVFFPDAFTPGPSDGAAINDIFSIIVGPGVLGINYFRIFNRWGVMVYEEKNLSVGESKTTGWNGEYQGIAQDPGVYVYVAEVVFIDTNADNGPLLYKGDMTLIR